MRVSGSERVLRGLLCLLALVSFADSGHAQRTVAGMSLPTLPTAAADAGALPGTQVVTLTAYLAPTTDRTASLDSFLAAIQTTGSPQHHQWLTPAAFAQTFGATADQLAAVQTWATQQGLSVSAVSPSGTYVTLKGTTTQVEAAMAPGLHAVQLNGQRYVTNTALPSLPAALAARILAIDGLTTVPPAATTTVRTEAGRVAVNDLLAAVTTTVEANTSRLLSIASVACVEDVDTSTAGAMHLLLKQAAAEGITTLASSGCNGRGSASYPGALAEVVSVAAAPGITPAVSPALTELRPTWQDAPGLPNDPFRYEPDLTVSSLTDFESTVMAILAKVPAGTNGSPDGSLARLGNIAATMYSMGPQPDVFTQPDHAAAGTWEAATGLGMTSLPEFLKHYPLGTSIAQVQIVPQSNTAGANLYSIPYGADETYKITVTGASGVPSGSVTVAFSPGGYSYTVALVGGTGTFSLDELGTQPPAGSGTEYQITATYSGDNTYAQGAYNTTNLYVNPAPITISANAAGSAGTLYVGGPYLVAVTLTAGSAVPTGTVTITPSPGTAQTISFPQNAGSNMLTANFTATVAGTINIQVTCTPGTNYVCNAPASTSVYVYKSTPNVSAVTVSNVAAQTATLSATVTGATGAVAPSGTVTFTTGSTTLCTTTASAAITGAVSCQSTNFPGTASGSVTATYNGDTNYNTATSTSTYTGALVTTKTTLATIASPVVVNTNINLVATIAATTTLNNTPPSGTITFYDGTTQIAQQTVANYQTSYTASVTLSTAGTHSITATYSGDTNYATSTSTAQTIVVAAAPAAVLTATPTGNIPYGNNVTLTAAITAIPNNGASTLAGSIKFNVNGTDAVTQTVALTNTTGTGATAVFPITQALDVGTYTVNLYCTGTNFDCSSFNTASFSFTVVKTNTTTTLQVNPGTFAAGQSIYATAIVAPAVAATGTGGVITGTVTFYDNANNVGTVSVYAANGGFQAVSTPFTVGSASDNIVAVYNGDGNNNSSKSTGSSTGTGGGSGGTYTTGITVAASPLTALNSAVVTLSATVTATATGSTTAAGVAGGTVNFYDTVNGTQVLIGSATLGAAGTSTATASLFTSALRDGANLITASYAGNSNFGASSTANGITVQITDYTLSFTPASLNLTAGQAGTITAAVNAVNGFTGQISLACTVPAGSATTCVANPSVITTSGLATFTITTTVRSAAVASHGAVEAEAGLAGTLLLCLALPLARRRRMRLLAIAVLVVLGSTLGCTNLVNPATGSGLGSGTPAGTEVLTITTSATDGVTTVRHTYQISVSVQ